MRKPQKICDLMRSAWSRLTPVPNPFEELPELEKFHNDVQQYKIPEEQFTATYQLKLHRRADWTGTHSQLKEFTYHLYNQLRKRGFPVYVHTAYRTPELQAKLQRAGNSTLRLGAHQKGGAVDIIHAHYHWEISNNAWKYIGLIGENIIRTKQYDIQWGGRWKNFPDPAHWEMKNWRALPSVERHSEPLHISPRGLLLTRSNSAAADAYEASRTKKEGNTHV